MKEQFGDDYNIEKRAAFLEIDKQEQKANKNRDYTAFAEYYEKAEKISFKNAFYRRDIGLKALNAGKEN